MSNNLLEHAKKELQVIIDKCEDEDDKKMQEYISQQILEIVETFSNHNHSGFSASYAIGLITRLLEFKPLTPLTGEDNEWNEIRSGGYQNNRFSSVFKDTEKFNGQAYDIRGKIFTDNGGKTWFTNGNSFVPITFPYYPTKPEKVYLEQKKED